MTRYSDMLRPRPRGLMPADPVAPATPLPPSKPPMKKGDEEAIKSTGSFVNSLAAGVAITGGLAPPLAYVNGALSAKLAFWQIGGASLVCFLAAAALHYVGRRYVKQELNR